MNPVSGTADLVGGVGGTWYMMQEKKACVQAGALARANVQACVQGGQSVQACRRAGGRDIIRARGRGRGARFFCAAQELIHGGQKNFSEFLTASYL